MSTTEAETRRPQSPGAAFVVVAALVFAWAVSVVVVFVVGYTTTAPPSSLPTFGEPEWAEHLTPGDTIVHDKSLLDDPESFPPEDTDGKTTAKDDMIVIPATPANFDETPNNRREKD